MSKILRNVMLAAGVLVAGQAMAQVTFYRDEGLRGESLTAESRVHNFKNYGFDNRAVSALVHSGRWEICTDEGYRGRCVILVPGEYRTLADMNMNFQVSSVRPLASEPEPVARSYVVPPAPAAAYTPEAAYRDGYRAGMRDSRDPRFRHESD